MRPRKSIALCAIALATVSALQPAIAQPRFGRDRGNPVYRDGYDNGYRDAYRDGYRAGYDDGRTNRRFDDRYGPPPAPLPPPGPPPRISDDREGRWRARYNQVYSYNDDNFYRECRQTVDPAGVIAGALIGGLLGNAVSGRNSRGVGTVAGIVIGGATGAALTRNMSCEDRSYAYQTYSDGFNAGRANAAYQWRNPQNGHYGEFQVRDYYNDPDGFRCANYTQQIFVNGQPQAATGRACQQPDGTWAIVS